MALIQTVHLSMANFKSAPVVPAVQNDSDRQVKMIIDDYTLTSGLTGKIAFERSDGTHYETAAELVLADNAFVADIDQALTQPGRTMVQLKVTDTLTVSTFSFVIFVEADNSGTVTPQEGIDLVTAVAAAEDAADRAESAAETLELDATLTSPTKAAQAKAVGDAIAKIDSDINNLEDDFADISEVTKNIFFGGLSNGNIDANGVVSNTPNNFLHCDEYIPVESSTEYAITAMTTSYFSQMVLLQFGSDKTCLSRSGVFSGAATKNKTVAITTGSTTKYIKFLLYYSSDISSSGNTIQIEKGIAYTGYVPHFTAYDRVSRDGVTDNANDIDFVKSKAEDIATYFFEKHKLKTAQWADGYYINPATGQPVSGAGYTYTEVDVLPSSAYKIPVTGKLYGAILNSSKEFVSGIIKDDPSTTVTLTVNVPANGAYIRLSVQTANVDLVDISISNQSILNSEILVSASQIISAENIITVSKDGTKDFTSLRSALESITDSSATKKYTVEFYGDGTEYNVVNNYTAAEIAANNVGLVIPPYVTLKGIGGKEKCILVGRLTSETTNRYFSVINLSGGANIDGFTLIGDYTRNVIHQDFGSNTDVESSVKNCYLQGSNLNLTYVLAAGVLSGCIYKYENSIFENLTAGGHAYSCHNNVSFTDSAFLKFDNCRFKVNAGTTDFSFRLGSINTGANGIECNCILKGCKIPVQLRLNQENASAYGTGILWKVSGYANDIAATGIYNTDGIDYSGNIDLI